MFWDFFYFSFYLSLLSFSRKKVSHCIRQKEYISLHGKCPYSEFFWPLFSRIRVFPYSVRMRENAGQKNFKYGHFSRSVNLREKFHHSGNPL